MKALTTALIILCLGLSARAQNLKKNDSVVSVSGGLQLAYKKSKVAVFFNEERIQKPSKNLFLIDELHELVFELDLKKNEIYGIGVTDGKVKKMLLAHGLNGSLDTSKLVQLNPEWKDTTFFISEQIQVLIKEELVYYYFNNRVLGKNIDNVDHSGLYSKERENYVFQSLTQPLFNIADHYFTTLTEEEDTCFQQMRWSNGKLEIENECVKELQFLELQKIIQVDEVIPTLNKGYYYTIKNNRWGLIYLHIENSIHAYEEGDDYGLKEHNIHFDFNELEPNKNDFIYQSIIWNQYVVFKDGNMTWVDYQSPREKKYLKEVTTQFTTYTINYEVVDIVIDGERMDAYEDPSLFNHMSVMNGGFGVTQINDSLFIINDYMNDEEILVYDPETGYEMYDENGYPEKKTIQGLKSSGVYDVKNHRWILDQGYHYIDYYGGSIMSALNASENDEPAMKYYDLEGNEVILDLSSKAGEYDFYNKAFSPKQENVERANSDYFNNQHFPDTIGSPNEILLYDGATYRFVPINDYFKGHKVPEEKRYDFIQTCIGTKTLNKMDYQFVIKDGTSYFQMNCQDVESSLKLKNKDFELVVEDFFGESYSSFAFFVVIEYDDTTEYYKLNDFYDLEVSKQSTYENPVADLSESLRVQKKDNLIIVNTTDYVEEIAWNDNDYFWGDDFQEEKSWEIEGSSIWSKNENGIWKQISEDYAQIMSTPFGFIARTGAYKNSWFDEETSNLKYDQAPSTFDLIGPDGNNIQRFDAVITDCKVFEDQKYYMMRLEGDTKWKLINDKAQLMHDDSFDYFEKEGDVIYGIDREMYDIDEYGYEKFDEDGNLVLLQKARKVKVN